MNFHGEITRNKFIYQANSILIKRSLFINISSILFEFTNKKVEIRCAIKLSYPAGLGWVALGVTIPLFYISESSDSG